MAKILRKFQKQFAVNAGASDIGVFGSLAAGSPTYSTDPATIQSLNAFMTGWAAETIADNRPALEDFNAIDFLTFYQLCYLLQTGVPEWNAETTYYIGSVVNDGTGILYASLADGNLNHAVTDATKWNRIAPAVVPPQDFSLVDSGDVVSQNSFTISDLVPGAKYKLVFIGAQESADAFLKLRCNGDSGPNYTWSDSGSSNFGESTTEIRGYYSTYKVVAGGTIMYDLDIFSVANRAFINGCLSFHYYFTDRLNTNFFGARYSGSSPLASVTILCDAGTMSGSWKLYRIS